MHDHHNSSTINLCSTFSIHLVLPQALFVTANLCDISLLDIVTKVSHHTEVPHNNLWPSCGGLTSTTQSEFTPGCSVHASVRAYGIHRFDSVIDIFCALRQESVGKIL